MLKMRHDEMGTVIAAPIAQKSQAWQFCTTNSDVSRLEIRVADQFLRREQIDDEPYDDCRLIIKTHNALAARFNHAEDRGMAAGDDAAVAADQFDAVIADEASEAAPLPCRGEQAKGQTAFASPGTAANEDAGLADHDCAGVNHQRRAGRCHIVRSFRGLVAQLAARSQTTKRAPKTVGSDSSLAGAIRFMARIRPPCASMIWREIDRPSPEF